jgi:hypothetical protein
VLHCALLQAFLFERLPTGVTPMRQIELYLH